MDWKSYMNCHFPLFFDAAKLKGPSKVRHIFDVFFILKTEHDRKPCIKYEREMGSIAGADLGILRAGGGGAGVLGRNSSGGGGRVQVCMNFHILTSKKTTLRGLNPLTPPPGPPLHCCNSSLV